MRTTNIRVTIDMPIPIDIPDENGFVYTREAVRDAVRSAFPDGVPLKWEDEIIGFVDGGYIASEADNKSVLRMYATIPFGGTFDRGVSLDDDKKTITKYRITEVAFCE